MKSKRNTVKIRDLDFLVPKFEEWWEAFYRQEFTLENDPEFHAEDDIQEACSILGIDRDELFRWYVNPLRGLDFKAVSTISRIQTRILGQHEMEHAKPLEFRVSERMTHPLNALSWLLVQIHDFHFANATTLCFANEWILDQYEHPNKQCRFCGRPDSDDRGHMFGKLKSCHKKCVTSSPNPTDHQEGCCTRSWLKAKKDLMGKLTNGPRTPEAMEFEYMKFVMDRYQENLSIRYQIRTNENENVKEVLPYVPTYQRREEKSKL